MDRLDYSDSDLKESIDFFENEIKQYQIAINGNLREEYKEYLLKKIKYYRIATMIINKFSDSNKEIRNAVIGEFAEKMKEVVYKWFEHGKIAIGMIDEIAEQIKESKVNE